MALNQDLLIVLGLALIAGVSLGLKLSDPYQGMDHHFQGNPYLNPMMPPYHHHNRYYEDHNNGSLFFAIALFSFLCLGLLFVANAAKPATTANKAAVSTTTVAAAPNVAPEQSNSVAEEPIAEQKKTSPIPVALAAVPNDPSAYWPKPKAPSSLPASDPSPQSANSLQEQFVLQIGPYKSPEAATKKVQELQNQAIRAKSIATYRNDQELYLVFAGPYSTINGAQAVKREIKDNANVAIKPAGL